MRRSQRQQLYCQACRVAFPATAAEGHGQSLEHLAAERSWRGGLAIDHAIRAVEMHTPLHNSKESA